MLFTLNPTAPWAAEMLHRPIAAGAATITISQEELPLLNVGRLVDRICRGGWASIGRFWRPAVQRDIEMLIEEHGIENVNEQLLRRVIPDEPPPSRNHPFLRGSTICWLPSDDEDRIMRDLEILRPGAWYRWAATDRIMFLEGVNGILERLEPEEISRAAVEQLVHGVEFIRQRRGRG